MPFSNTFLPFAKADIEQSIPARFEYQVARRGHGMAVATNKNTVSYRELDESSNRVAHAILELRGNEPEPVALLLPQGLTAINAILGILKTGKFYVPLDPHYAADSIAVMLEASGARLLLSDHGRNDLARDLGSNDLTVLNLDHLNPNLPGNRLGLNIAPDALAYIFFTSGSTGEPKGVFDTHRNVLHNILRYTNTLHVSTRDRLTLIQACSFSGTVSSLFAALLNGACVLPFDLASNTPSAVVGWLQQQKATIYHSTPGIFRSLLQAAQQRIDSIRVVRLEGDQAFATDAALYRHWFAKDCVLVNGLGTTETGLVSQYFADAELSTNDNIFPVGYAVEDIEVLILNEGKRVPSGEVGEIGVRSNFLASGYWQRPELTRERFVGMAGDRVYLTGDLGRVRSDGCLEHLGRIDARVKIRGQPVGLTHLEAVLRCFDEVTEAIVVVRNDENNEAMLVAYLVVKNKPGPTVGTLRHRLGQFLPSHAIPARYVILDALPLNAAGKLDHYALPKPNSTRPALDNLYTRHDDLVQLRLIQIWEELLQVIPVGITDDFFELGGHSLSAVQMLDQVAQEFGQQLSPTLLLSGATIKNLSCALGAQSQSPQMVAFQTEGARQPFYFFHGDYISGGIYCRHLIQHLNQEQPLYAISPYGLDGGAIPPTYQAMARAHLKEIRRTRPHGPYRLGGVCNGGLVALEIARMLREEGESVERLFLVSASVANVRFTRLRHRIDNIARWVGVGPKARELLFWRLRRLVLYLEDLPIHQRVAFFLTKIPKIPLRLLELLKPHKKNVATTDQGATNLETIFHQIDATYIPRPYPHPVTLVWGSDELESPEEAVEYWRQLGATVSLKVMPGWHTDAVTQYVEQLAKQLQTYLDQ